MAPINTSHKRGNVNTHPANISDFVDAKLVKTVRGPCLPKTMCRFICLARSPLARIRTEEMLQLLQHAVLQT
eukprot:Skav216797  [mRNA]  locus=scaffold2110:23590:23805:+ [translate_table: standard]